MGHFVSLQHPFPPPGKRQRWLDQLEKYEVSERFDIIEWLVDRAADYYFADKAIREKLEQLKCGF